MNKKLFSMAVLSIILLSGIDTVQAVAQNVSPASDFECDLNGDGTGVVICKYKGQRKDVVIPSSIEDIPVVELDVSAFSGTDIVSVVIPNSVTDIGFYCFANCRLHTSYYGFYRQRNKSDIRWCICILPQLNFI